MISARFLSLVRFSHKSALTLANAERLCEKTDIIDVSDDFLKYGNVKRMMHQFPFFVRDSIPRTDPELTEVVKRYDEVCYYTGPERELYPGPILMDCYTALESPENQTVANLKLASMLAWVFDHATTSIIIIDDILDGNIGRWKKPSWHSQSHIGLSVLLDGKLATMGTFAILRKYLHSHPKYKYFHELLSKLVYLTNVGQCIDATTSEHFQKTRDISLISFERYQTIVKYKTNFILYTAPPLAAMYLAKIDTKLYFDSQSLFEQFSIYRQAQNDMWDIFSRFETIGKIGTDITGGKCTWITSTALIHANESQKKALLENYGKSEVECVNVCYNIFYELDILGKYKKFKEDLVRACEERTGAVGHPGFTKMINTILEHYIVTEDFQS